MAETSGETKQQTPLWVSLAAGAAAGVATDISLFPLDTIKTRLQSSQGFLKAGGFRGMYSGLSAAAAGSAPSAALFFATYDTINNYVNRNHGGTVPLPVSHMFAASCGEVMACLARVPAEVVKQRLQAGNELSFTSAMINCYRKEGFAGFYRGFGITVFREVPFSLMQFPMYEYLKQQIRANRERRGLNSEVPSAHAALCGSITGAISAALTTPMDVVKTRIMLGRDKQGAEYRGVQDCFTRLVAGA